MSTYGEKAILINTDTWLVWTIWHVLSVSVLTGFRCNVNVLQRSTLFYVVPGSTLISKP